MAGEIGEIWLPIKGYDGYEVSNQGRIRSTSKWRSRIYKQQANIRWGYLYVRFTPYKKTLRVNRLVAITFISNPENKPEVNHKNGIKTDNRVENLEWVTPSENCFHGYRIGIKKPSFGARKLTDNQVLEIKDLIKLGIRGSIIGPMYGVHKTAIYSIIKGKTWA